MAIPRFLFGVPLLVAGILLPASGGKLASVPANAVGMDHEVFTSDVVKVRQGDTVTLVNNSRFVHIIGEGRGGRLSGANTAPVDNRRLMETNDTYTTGKWNKPGDYYLTCTVH